MTIKENLERVKQELQAGVEAGDPTLDNRLRSEGVQALFAGVHSTEWRNLMRNFADADRPEQLARLTFNDPQAADPEVRKNALYLAALAACGADTIQNSNNYVNPDILDATL